MSDAIFDPLKAFIVKQAMVTEDEVTDAASIQGDLGVYGDDAVAFMIAFGKAFNVTVSSFMAAEYFSPEGDPLLPALIRLITGKKRVKRKELTVMHLKKAILAGRLDAAIINST